MSPSSSPQLLRNRPRQALLACLCLAALSPVAAEQRKGIEPVPKPAAVRSDSRGFRGVLIGINRYRDARIPPLRLSVADVVGIHSALEERGIPADRLQLMTDNSTVPPTRSAIIDAVIQLRSAVRPGETVLFYFTGHGIARDEEGYLAPIDARVDDLEATALSLSDIFALLPVPTGGATVMVIDACHSGGVKGPVEYGRMDPDFDRRLMWGAAGTAVLSACKVNQSSYEAPGGQHGLFTQGMLDVLEGRADADSNGDGWLQVTELFTMTASRVQDRARQLGLSQTPQLKATVTPDAVLCRAPIVPVAPVEELPATVSLGSVTVRQGVEQDSREPRPSSRSPYRRTGMYDDLRSLVRRQFAAALEATDFIAFTDDVAESRWSTDVLFVRGAVEVREEVKPALRTRPPYVGMVRIPYYHGRVELEFRYHGRDETSSHSMAVSGEARGSAEDVQRSGIGALVEQATADAIRSFAAQLQNRVLVESTITEVDESRVVIALGRKHGVRPGMQFVVTVPRNKGTSPGRHTAGVLTDDVGSIRVTEVRDQVSVCSIEKWKPGSAPRPGMQVRWHRD